MGRPRGDGGGGGGGATARPAPTQAPTSAPRAALLNMPTSTKSHQHHHSIVVRTRIEYANRYERLLRSCKLAELLRRSSGDTCSGRASQMAPRERGRLRARPAGGGGGGSLLLARSCGPLLLLLAGALLLFATLTCQTQQVDGPASQQGHPLAARRPNPSGELARQQPGGLDGARQEAPPALAAGWRRRRRRPAQGHTTAALGLESAAPVKRTRGLSLSKSGLNSRRMGEDSFGSDLVSHFYRDLDLDLDLDLDRDLDDDDDDGNEEEEKEEDDDEEEAEIDDDDDDKDEEAEEKGAEKEEEEEDDAEAEEEEEDQKQDQDAKAEAKEEPADWDGEIATAHATGHGNEGAIPAAADDLEAEVETAPAARRRQSFRRGAAGASQRQDRAPPALERRQSILSASQRRHRKLKQQQQQQQQQQQKQQQEHQQQQQPRVPYQAPVVVSISDNSFVSASPVARGTGDDERTRVREYDATIMVLVNSADSWPPVNSTATPAGSPSKATTTGGAGGLVSHSGNLIRGGQTPGARPTAAANLSGPKARAVFAGSQLDRFNYIVSDPISGSGGVPEAGTRATIFRAKPPNTGRAHWRQPAPSEATGGRASPTATATTMQSSSAPDKGAHFWATRVVATPEAGDQEEEEEEEEEGQNRDEDGDRDGDNKAPATGSRPELRHEHEARRGGGRAGRTQLRPGRHLAEFVARSSARSDSLTGSGSSASYANLVASPRNELPLNGAAPRPRFWHSSQPHLASIRLVQEDPDEYQRQEGGLNSAIIAILFGIGATGMLVIIVGAKMRSIRARLAHKGRRRSLVPDTDFLINTIPT